MSAFTQVIPAPATASRTSVLDLLSWPWKRRSSTLEIGDREQFAASYAF